MQVNRNYKLNEYDTYKVSFGFLECIRGGVEVSAHPWHPPNSSIISRKHTGKIGYQKWQSDLWTYFTPSSSVSAVDSEQVNVSWNVCLHKNIKIILLQHHQYIPTLLQFLICHLIITVLKISINSRFITISNKSQVQWMVFIANKVSRFFYVWSSKAQTGKEVSNFILNASVYRALSKHWIVTFYYLFGTEFSSGNQAPSCWFKNTSCVHKTYSRRQTLGKPTWSVLKWLINDIPQLITWTWTVYEKISPIKLASLE